MAKCIVGNDIAHMGLLLFTLNFKPTFLLIMTDPCSCLTSLEHRIPLTFFCQMH